MTRVSGGDDDDDNSRCLDHNQSVVKFLGLGTTVLSRVTVDICLFIDWFMEFCAGIVCDVVDTQALDSPAQESDSDYIGSVRDCTTAS